MNTYVVLDCDNICHRNWHAMRTIFRPERVDPRRVGENMPAVHGMLRDLATLARNLDSAKFTFCFDGTVHARAELYPQYKANRGASPERSSIQREINLLREQILPSLGYKAVYRTSRAEADDLIAMACRKVKPADHVILVSGDQDLFQLLRPGVSMWNLNQKMLVNDQWVLKQHDVEPHQWAMFKAIAGCPSDNIPGVVGVGAKSAALWLREQLPESNRKYRLIQEGWSQAQFFRRLTELPYEGLSDPGVRPGEYETTPEKWDEVVRRWGLPKLVGRCPGREVVFE